MRITPLDIRKQEFRKVVRGLDPEEITAFLATVADEYEAVLVDNKQLREHILETDEKLGEYHNMEKTLRDTLITAERVLDETRENARKEAGLTVREAELRGQQITQAFQQQANELRKEITVLHREKEAYLMRFKALAEAQIQFIENHQSDFADLDRQLLSVSEALGPQEPPDFSQPRLPKPERSHARYRTGGHRDEWREYVPGSSRSRSRQPAAARSSWNQDGPDASEADHSGDVDPSGESTQENDSSPPGVPGRGDGAARLGATGRSLAPARSSGPLRAVNPHEDLNDDLPDEEDLQDVIEQATGETEPPQPAAAWTSDDQKYNKGLTDI
jgi:cell division initiation protein